MSLNFAHINANEQILPSSIGSALLAPNAAVLSLHADSSPSLTGNIQFVSGSNITLSQIGQAITINASGGSGVSSITGTANEVLANGTFGLAQTGAVTLTTPQAIAITSSPTFFDLTLTDSSSSTTLLLNGNGGITLTSNNDQRWINRSNLLTARGFASYTTLPNGKMLAIGGRDNSNNALASCEIYDPIANTWTATGSLNTPRFCHVSVLLNTGKVLVVAGHDNGGVLGTSELYDPSLGTWSFTGSLSTPRTCAAIWTLPSGKILIASGFPATTSAEIYDPSLGTWSSAASAPHNQLDVAFASTGDGRALMAGDAQGFNQGISVYTEGFNTWTYFSGTFPSNAEEGNQAIQLSNGNVLIAGGVNSSGVPQSSCFIFNQLSNTISSTGSLNTARCGASSFLRSDGIVVIVGGDDDASTLFTSVEQYNPISGTWNVISSTNVAHARMAHDKLPILSTGLIFAVGGETTPGAGAINNVEALVFGGGDITLTCSSSVHGGNIILKGTESGHGNINMAKLIASTALISDDSKNIASSSVTSTELNYVSGVTSAIQTQINGKLSLSGGTMSGNIDMGKHQLVNAVIQTGTSEPGSPSEGQIFYRTDTHQAELWNGTSWVILG